MKGKANIIVGAIVAAIVVASIAAYALPQMGAAGGASAEADAADGTAGLRALVHDGDGGILELPLSEDTEKTVATDLGMNVVVVEGGSVYVRDADCGNRDCVHQGKINAPGRQIICLPHRLWIEVVATGQPGGEMDESAVAGDSGGLETLDALAR